MNSEDVGKLLTLIVVVVLTIIVGKAIYTDVLQPLEEQRQLCEDNGGDYCLSEKELECKTFCDGDYFYSISYGGFGADNVVCACGGNS